MLTSITLRNFKSFGEEQTIPLQPITVLVGPNNSGKSNLVSVGRFVRNAVMGDVDSAFKEEGGTAFVFHRPTLVPDLCIAWKAKVGAASEWTYSTRISWDLQSQQFVQQKEVLELGGRAYAATRSNRDTPFGSLKQVVASPKTHPDPYAAIAAPIVHSREIKLSLSALRADAEVVPTPRLEMDGSNLPIVLGLWRGSDPGRVEQLESFVKRCLPEIRHVLVRPSPVPGYQRLWVQQDDVEQLDAVHVSDGVLHFIAMAMHAIEADPGSLLFIEEPEQSIHPRRLGELIDLFRQIVHERQCQVVIATHSPVLLHHFRDEPEAIVLFRRGKNGTLVNPLTDFPDLMAALDKGAEPGDMLANGFLNEPS